MRRLLILALAVLASKHMGLGREADVPVDQARQRTVRHALAPAPADREVRDDPEEPRERLARGLTVGQLVDQATERLLEQVLGRGLVPGQAHREAEDRSPVGVVRLERGRAGLGATRRGP